MVVRKTVARKIVHEVLHPSSCVLKPRDTSGWWKEVTDEDVMANVPCLSGMFDGANNFNQDLPEWGGDMNLFCKGRVRRDLGERIVLLRE